MVDLASGHCFFRGKRNTWRGLPRPKGLPKDAPIVSSGAVLTVEIDQRRHEMTIELSTGAGGEPSSVVLEELPDELTLALGLGDGAHRVRLLRCDERPAESPKLQELAAHRDVWDPQNVVPPLRTQMSQRVAAVRDADTWDLQRAWQEAVVEEAARIGG